jgi:hypothetical protein
LEEKPKKATSISRRILPGIGMIIALLLLLLAGYGIFMSILTRGKAYFNPPIATCINDKKHGLDAYRGQELLGNFSFWKRQKYNILVGYEMYPNVIRDLRSHETLPPEVFRWLKDKAEKNHVLLQYELSRDLNREGKYQEAMRYYFIAYIGTAMDAAMFKGGNIRAVLAIFSKLYSDETKLCEQFKGSEEGKKALFDAIRWHEKYLFYQSPLWLRLKHVGVFSHDTQVIPHKERKVRRAAVLATIEKMLKEEYGAAESALKPEHIIQTAKGRKKHDWMIRWKISGEFHQFIDEIITAIWVLSLIFCGYFRMNISRKEKTEKIKIQTTKKTLATIYLACSILAFAGVATILFYVKINEAKEVASGLLYMFGYMILIGAGLPWSAPHSCVWDNFLCGIVGLAIPLAINSTIIFAMLLIGTSTEQKKN